MSNPTVAADLILTNCRYVMDGFPSQSRNALAIWKDRILAIDSAADIDSLRGSTTDVIDIRDRYLLPGLTDSHIHLAAYARSLDRVDCDTDTVDKCLERLSSRAAELEPGEWLEGHGWDQNRWGRFGRLEDLDLATRGRPTYLTARSLHAAWANSAALELAGIGPDSLDPSDGRIGRLESGAPDGILYEGAMELIATLVPSPSPAALAHAIERAQSKLWRYGITAVHDFDRRDCLIALQELRREGRLGIRVLKQIMIDYLEQFDRAGLQSEFGDRWIQIGNIKVFSDGALGPRTAAMLDPYEGEPDNTGILLKDEEELLEIGIQAGESGFPLAIHAIGDAANHAALNALAALRNEEQARGWPARRHRLEHLQLMHPSDLPRPAQLGVLASMQPIHAMSDRPTADRYWGQRVEHAYAWRSQVDHGARLVFGSDAPVESPNPFWGISAAISRLDFQHRERPAWHPDQAVTLQTALHAYTTGPAIAARAGHEMGSIRPGYLADLIILDQHPADLSAIELSGLLPVGVIVGGQWRLREF